MSHMVVCGDDALAHRLADELSRLYGERVTVVLPSARRSHGPPVNELRQGGRVAVVEAAEPDERALRDAGVGDAVALALTYEDDQVNIHAALRARRINPDIRLVVRMYNRKLGRHLEELLERAAAARSPHLRADELDASATVLSDADTAAPALVGAALGGSENVVHREGLLLRADERPLGSPELDAPALCTLALLSDSAAHPEGEDTVDGVRLLPDDDAVREADGVHGRVVLEAVSRGPEVPALARRGRRRRRRGGIALRELLPSQLWFALAGLLALQGAFAVVDWWVIGGPFPHAGYLALLDILNINEPAIGESFSRQLLQVLSGITGMALLPVLFAVVLQTLGAFRTVSALRLPPRGLSGHVVLVGLGRVGSRTLDLLSSLDIDVVCVERDPGARGVALARSRRIPVVIGDATQEGVLEAAKIGRSRALLALTSDDGTNLEAVLYAREAKPELRVVMRLFDDNFASTLYNTLRDSYPHATTRSRSVSTLCAPAFAVAMMGRQILGSIPVERQVLLFATVEVRGQGELEGRSVRDAFRPGEWRPVALDHEPEPVWDLDPDYVLKPDDRVLLAATRHGLARLLR